MPFTFAHPAIVLPLIKVPSKYISATAIIIGSMAPDYEYFLRLKVDSTCSHTALGIFIFDLPLNILLCFIFHNIVKRELILNLPNGLSAKVASCYKLDWNQYFKKHYFVVLVSACIGILSHLVWDSFTHETGYFMQELNLSEYSVNVFETTIPLYKILQHSSTVLGGLFIMLFLYRLPSEQLYPRSSFNFRYFAAVVVIAFLLLICYVLFTAHLPAKGNLIVVLLSGIQTGLITAPLFKRFYKKD